MRRMLIAVLALLAAGGWVVASLDAWCAHVTNAAGWKTTISLYNPGSVNVTVSLRRYGTDGNPYGSLLQIEVPPMAWAQTFPADLGYSGTAHLTAAADLEVKLSYQSGDSPSVCEFFLTGEKSPGWMLPNTVRAWMNYTGVALMNPEADPVSVTFEAWLTGNLIATTTVAVPAGGQYLRLSDGIWAGMAYAGFDTIRIRSSRSLPAPIAITGNYAGDRHLFFSARPMAGQAAGDLVEVDPIVGNLRVVPSGTFTQGSPTNEPCRSPTEAQFTHTLTKALAVMETEVTRQMWADLKAVQPTLPADPTQTASGAGMSNPVQSLSWYEAMLFANLLSVQQGLVPCYYTDPGFTTPITSLNYQSGAVYCKWTAAGYRLPSEGEWEHFCRAGTTDAFWIEDANYLSGNCGTASTPGMYPQLETAGWFKGNSAVVNATSPVGAKAANPWNLKDVLGNVWEWCWDWFNITYPVGTLTDYTGADAGLGRVLRGGGWSFDAQLCRSARRMYTNSTDRYDFVGFRLCRLLP